MNRDEYISKSCNILIRSFALTTQQALMLRTSMESCWNTGAASRAESDRKDYERLLEQMHARANEIVAKINDAKADEQIDVEYENFIAQRDDDYDRNVAARQGSRF